MPESSMLPVAEDPSAAAAPADLSGAERSSLRRLRAFDGGPPVPVEELRADSRPQVGDRIMVVKQPWLDRILDGAKTMELRGQKHCVGHTWLGAGGYIHGRVKIAQSVPLTEEEFKARQEEHQWPLSAGLPYKSIYGLILEDVETLPAPISYWRPPRGPIGWNIYRRAATDAPMKTTRAGGMKRPAARVEDSPDAADPDHSG